VRRQVALAVLLAAAGAVGFALAVAPGPEGASAHDSDCHFDQTCPADDGSYPWVDANGQTWICWVRNPADAAQADATEIVFEELAYACWAVPPPPTETTVTVTTTATLETEPIEPEPELETTTVEDAPAAASQYRSGALKVFRGKQPKAPPVRRPKPRAPVVLPPGGIVPRLTQKGYVFPVYGPAAFVDTFGAGRADTGWHHGEDIFAPLGAPLLAVADGTVFSVGWNDLGGNRLWLRDEQGNEFYYAHLSAFSPLAVDGAHVRAGDVVGFLGNTGDAETTPPHLHFEIHPVGLLSLGYDGVIAPYPYLTAWQRLDDLPFGSIGLARVGWTSYAPTSLAAPTPGAVLLASADISTAASLGSHVLEQALEDAPVFSGESPLADTPAAGPPVAGLSRRPDEALLAVLRRLAEAAAAANAPVDGIWDALSLCEAGGRWAYDGSSGFDGGLQFHPATWSAYRLPGYPEYAWRASRTEQIAVARRVLAEQGWEAWPVCSRRLGLR
jgi:murein DD-endopeptidase MepM/ murein hydrolase activator NlpD